MSLLLLFDEVAGGGTTLTPGVVSHTYTGQVPQADVATLPARVLHTYTGNTAQIRQAVPAPLALHTYTAQTAKANIATLPARALHTYSGLTPKASTALRPAVTTHTYTAQTAKANTALLPARALHTYSGLEASILSAGTVSVPVATHTYTAQTPQADLTLKPAASPHTYTAQTASLTITLRPAAAAHTYTGLNASANVTATQTQTPAAATHTYSMLLPTIIGVRDTGAGSGGRGSAGRRRHWQVEYKGEIREFATAQEAHDWLAHEIAEDKAERKEDVKQAKAEGRKVKPVAAPKPEIRFDGIEVTRWRYQGKSVADQLINGDFLAKMARHIQDRLDDDDDAEAIAVIH